jgi:hypothetical protein
MENSIEMLDLQRARMLRGFISSFVVFFTTWVVRFVLRLSEIESTSLQIFLLVILIGTLLPMAFFSLRLSSIRFKIRRDPQLNRAMNDELVRLHEIKAWRWAFIAVISFLSIIGAISLIAPIRDLIFVILTAILFGLLAYHSTFYLMEKNT